MLYEGELGAQKLVCKWFMSDLEGHKVSIFILSDRKLNTTLGFWYKRQYVIIIFPNDTNVKLFMHNANAAQTTLDNDKH